MQLNHQITLKMLRYFYATAQCGQFSLAAQQLNITKSPLSAQIKELEHLLGVSLFERNTRNVALTVAGKQLQQECHLIFEVLDTALNRVQKVDREHGQTFNIGLMSSIFWAGFGDTLYQVQKRSPQQQFNLLEMSPKKQKMALLNHQIDIGLARYADSINIHPLQARTLYKEKMVVVVSDKHRLKDYQKLSLSELISEEFVMLKHENSASTELITQHCLKLGFHLKIEQEVVEPNTLLAVVSTRNFISIVPASYGSQQWPHICFIPLKESIPADICALYCAEGNNKTQQFIQSITAKS